MMIDFFSRPQTPLTSHRSYIRRAFRRWRSWCHHPLTSFKSREGFFHEFFLSAPFSVILLFDVARFQPGSSLIATRFHGLNGLFAAFEPAIRLGKKHRPTGSAHPTGNAFRHTWTWMNWAFESTSLILGSPLITLHWVPVEALQVGTRLKLVATKVACH